MALSATALAFASDPQYRGPLDNATHYGVGGSPGDGPYFQLWLIVERGRITKASYQTPGCPSSMAVGGGLCRLISGRELERVSQLSRDDLTHFVGPLPEGKEYCFDLAITALTKAEEIEKDAV